MNPFVVQSILGHTSLDMTGRYTHLSMDAQTTGDGGDVQANGKPDNKTNGQVGLVDWELHA